MRKFAAIDKLKNQHVDARGERCKKSLARRLLNENLNSDQKLRGRPNGKITRLFFLKGIIVHRVQSKKVQNVQSSGSVFSFWSRGSAGSTLYVLYRECYPEICQLYFISLELKYLIFY